MGADNNLVVLLWGESWGVLWKLMAFAKGRREEKQKRVCVGLSL